jgi:adhesin transport system membrane fusion protein
MSKLALEDRLSRLSVTQPSRWLLWAIAGFFVAFVIWANFAQLNRTVRGPGRVVPSAQLQILSNHEGGVVDAILVKVGDRVLAGTPLVRLVPTAAQADLGSTAATVSALQAKVSRLSAEVTGTRPALPQTPDTATERTLYLARMAQAVDMEQASQARIIQAQRSISEAQATLASRNAAASAAQSELGVISQLTDAGIEPRLSLIRAQSAATMAASDVLAAQAVLARAEAGLAEARATQGQKQQEWRSSAAQDLSVAKAELAAKGKVLPALEDRLDRTLIRASLTGRVNRVLVTTIGSSVAPGAPVAEIVPDDTRLTIEAQIRPSDIARVRLDQPVKIEITAYDSSIYGSLKGRVRSISPDTITDQRTGNVYYVVQVTTEGALRDPKGQVLPLGPGMVANVSLLGDSRSVMAYLLTPWTRLGEKAFRE